MATTFVDYTGDGNATKAFSFPSIQESDIKVTVDEVLKSSGTHYNITSYTTTGGGNVVFTSGNIPASPAAIRIFRDTSVDAAKATYTAGSSVKADDLNANHKQLLFAVQEEQNIVSSTQTVKGFISAADKVKLDGIETAATADQTAAEIRTLVESATDSNVFTDADHTKLNAIEAGATGDQSDAEIRAAVEAASDSNVFTDADHAKLNGIETSATADQTDTEIKTAYENNSDTNAFTDAEKTKLSGIATGADVTSSNSINALTDVNTAGVADGKILKYDSSTSKFIIADDTGGGGGGGGSSTFTGLSDTPANFGSAAGKTVKVNAAGNALEFVTVTTSTQDIVDDTTPQLGGNLDVQTNEINTSTTNGNIKVTPNGTGVFEVKGNTNAGTLQLNCENNSHGVKIKGPAHSAAASYTLTLPDDDGTANQVLKTDGSGNLSWVNQTTDTNTQLSTEEVQDIVGGMVTGNTETGITVTYEDGDGTLDFAVGTLNQDTTGTADHVTITDNENTDENNLIAFVEDAQGAGSRGLESDGDFHYNPSTGTVTATAFAGSGAALTGISGAVGGGTDKIFYENGQTVTTNYTISNNNNAMSAGPITINSGVAVTIGTGENWTIV
tara:strand:+ start:5302 stop:7146 length:1845 start_codon:yes stop_codon:yes gene_type:complete